MTGPAADLDVKTAISTIDKALAYTQPLRRRTEGLTWLLFGLASAIFPLSYGWIWENGFERHYRLILVWLAGYALLSIGPGLLAWRIASIVSEDYRIDPKRVAATVSVLAVLLVGLNFAFWGLFGATQLSVALNIVIFGGAAWSGLALGQWARLSQTGRRDTWLIGAAMALAGAALVYLLRADTTTVALDVMIFVISMGAIPAVAGWWRLARG
jgi:hypothetical protein